MFREYDEKDGQLLMDLRLDSEKDLQGNIATMVDFAELVRKDMAGEQRIIRSKQEGYGYLAQLYVTVGANMKNVKVGMDKLLGMLGGDPEECADQAASIYNSCQDVIESALLMAAEARKVSQDLYSIAATTQSSMNPIEEAIANEGFSEPSSEVEISGEEED